MMIRCRPPGLGRVGKFAVLVAGVAACLVSLMAAPMKSARTGASTPRYALRAERTWHLELPGGARFDASGLLLWPDGSLLTVNDKTPGVWRIELGEGDHATLKSTGWLTAQRLALVTSEKTGPWDCEGLARDDAGRIYVCDESDRWIVRQDPVSGKVERLPIDWTPVRRWFSSDRNASFEGIAVGGETLYVANEREIGRIIEVDLATAQVRG